MMRKVIAFLLLLTIAFISSCTNKKTASQPNKDIQEKDFEQKIKIMLEDKKSLDGQEKDSTPPLVKAVSHGYVDSVKLLLKKGANPNIKEKMTKTSALHRAIAPADAPRPNAKESELLMILLQNNAVVNSLDKYSNTPLHIAASAGRLEAAKLLLKHKADFRLKNLAGKTPLHEAATRGYYQIIELLINEKADVNALTRGRRVSGGKTFKKLVQPGKTALDLARLRTYKKDYEEKKKNKKDSYKYADYKKTIEILEKADALTSLEIKRKKEQESAEFVNDNKGSIPTNRKQAGDAKKDKEEENEDKKKVKIDAEKDKYGNTPLHLAVNEGDIGLVKLLLDKGMNPNIKNFKGQTPMHMAASRGYHSMIAILLNRRGNVNALTKTSKLAPLDFAIARTYGPNYKKARKSNKEAYGNADYDKTIRILKSAGGKERIKLIDPKLIEMMEKGIKLKVKKQ